MRYRLLATYQGAPYEAGLGPDESGVVLFAACPPPEDLRFEPATGHWRKRVSRADVQALYQSLPLGMFRGERCVVLDDLNDRLHIAYLGHDSYRAERLGYWEVDRGVFELITPRQEVTEIVEQRLPLALQAGLRSTSQGPVSDGFVSVPVADESPLPLEAEALRAAGLSEPSSALRERTGPSTLLSWTPHPRVPDQGEAAPAHSVPMPAPPGDSGPAPVNGTLREDQASAAGLLPGAMPSPGSAPDLAKRPLAAAAAAAFAVTRSLLDGQRPGQAETAAALASDAAPGVLTEAGSPTGGVNDETRQASRPRRASRRRPATQRIFSELAAQA